MHSDTPCDANNPSSNDESIPTTAGNNDSHLLDGSEEWINGC